MKVSFLREKKIVWIKDLSIEPDGKTEIEVTELRSDAKKFDRHALESLETALPALCFKER